MKTEQERAALLTQWYAHVARGGGMKPFLKKYHTTRETMDRIFADAGLPRDMESWSGDNALQRLREDEATLLRGRLRRANAHAEAQKEVADKLRAQLKDLGLHPCA